MTPSVYVIQRSSGQLYCVTKAHYEQYPHWYDLVSSIKKDEPAEDPITPLDIAPSVDIEMTVKDKKVHTRTRKTTR